MDFDLRNIGIWLSGRGRDTDIVISTRLRLARNLRGFPFRGRISPEEEKRLEAFLSPKVVDAALNGGLRYVKLHELDEVDRMLLLENHLISMEFFTAEGPRGVAFNEDGTVSIMVNEEDHLRIQVLGPGLALEESWKRIDEIDDRLGALVNYAFDTQFGFLTSCPTNVGTGLRVSVMLHLPALVLSKHIEKVFHAVSQVNLAVRGFFGEGSQAVGDFYQISNQITLGLTPEEIIESLSRVLPKVIEYEREVRKALQSDGRKVLDDKVWRALGMLRTARTIATEETMALLSSVRLGVAMGILEDVVDPEVVNRLFLEVQPGHLQRTAGRTLEAAERDVLRADLVRQRFQETPLS